MDAEFHHQMKHLEVRQKHYAARRILNSLLSVLSGDETLRPCLIFYMKGSEASNSKNSNSVLISIADSDDNVSSVVYSPHVGESGIRDTGIWNMEYWAWKSGILGLGIRDTGLGNPGYWAWESVIHLKESRIPLTTGIQNPRSTNNQRLKSSAWSPGSKNVLDSLAWGKAYAFFHKTMFCEFMRANIILLCKCV